MPEAYDQEFFDYIRAGARRSADVIVPLLIEHIQPQSVVDVGCAEGTFLAAFQRAGIDDVWGVDGDYVDRDTLEIPSDRFEVADLNRPYRNDRRFDLALSLEVAEHLKPERSESFIEDLVRLAPVVCFSAAIPNQIGTGHINGRWQDEWAEIFRSHNYAPVDFLRGEIWERVEPWYAQNIIVYARPDKLSGSPPSPMRVVHPGVLDMQVRRSRVLFGRDVLRGVRQMAGRHLRKLRNGR